MMPCKFCGVDPSKKGIKQVGKTETEGASFVRQYLCQDCGATMRMTGNLSDASAPTEDWATPKPNLRLV